MSIIVIKDFNGLIPRASEELLASNFASEAINCDLRSGEIRPLRSNLSVNTPTKVGTKKTIYLFGNTFWFHWLTDVDVIKGPIAGDTSERTYFTGDGNPKVTDNSIATVGGTNYPTNAYEMGIPAPSTAPTVSVAVITAATGNISNITWRGGDSNGKFTPIILSTADHGRKVGEYVTLANIGGSTGLNGNRYKIIEVPTTDVFVLDTGEERFANFTTGGTWEVSVSDEVSSTTYVYTFAGFIGGKLIESAPSPASAVIDVPHGAEVAVDGMLTTPGAGAFAYVTKKRIYRANTGNFGTEYQFVDEVVDAVTLYNDFKTNDELGDVLSTFGWLPPPTDFAGLIVLPNGITAGFSKNELCLSIPYQPHAYPNAYRYAINNNIVGLGHYGTTIVICTDGTPHISQAYDPQSAGPVNTEIEQACSSKRSIASLDAGVIYASPDGLVMVNAAGSRIISDSVFTKEEWTKLKPSSIHGYVHDQRYIGFYDTGVVQAGFIFDPSNPKKGFVHLDFYATAGYRDLLNDKLYLQVGDDIVEMEGGTTFLSMTWKSVELRTDRLLNFGWGQVIATQYPVTFKLYADAHDGSGEQLRHTQTINTRAPFRLPAGFVSDRWRVELNSTTGGQPRAAYLAESIGDLQRTA